MPNEDDVALIVLAAARLGPTRLIDNITFDLELISVRRSRQLNESAG